MKSMKRSIFILFHWNNQYFLGHRRINFFGETFHMFQWLSTYKEQKIKSKKGSWSLIKYSLKFLGSLQNKSREKVVGVQFVNKDTTIFSVLT